VKVPPLDVHPSEVRPAQVHAHEKCLSEVHVPEVGAAEVRRSERPVLIPGAPVTHRHRPKEFFCAVDLELVPSLHAFLQLRKMFGICHRVDPLAAIIRRCPLTRRTWAQTPSGLRPRTLGSGRCRLLGRLVYPRPVAGGDGIGRSGNRLAFGRGRRISRGSLAGNVWCFGWRWRWLGR